MDSRAALKAGAVLRFINHEGGTVMYTIAGEIGRGASCIVYEASYQTNAGDIKLVRIKECCPLLPGITRMTSGELDVNSDQTSEFQTVQDKMLEDFRLSNKLLYSEGLSDSLVNSVDVYHANHTTYVVTAWLDGKTLDTYEPASLKSCLFLVRQIAQTLQHVHEHGFLYLDMKPQNVLILDSQSERILLFDFDSLFPFSIVSGTYPTEKRLSFTRGFAPIELQRRQLKKLGPYSDVYEIGVLLFTLLFGETPSPPECESNAQFDFSKMKWFREKEYPDKLFFGITAFFHKTLAFYYRDRIQTMVEVVQILDELTGFADLTIPFLFSTRIEQPAICVGREAEMLRLAQWFSASDSSKVLFISGLGGIGKSTLIRNYLSSHREDFCSILYLHDVGSITGMITDDVHVHINTLEKDEKENADEYFDRKIRKLRELLSGKNSVLIIDDFAGEITADFSAIFSVDWKIVIVTRKKPQPFGKEILSLEAIHEREKLYELFEFYAGKAIAAEEHPFIDRIIEKVAGHSLVLQLIASQTARSYLTLPEAASLVETHGFTNIAPEKIRFEKDQMTYTASIQNIINAIFSAEKQSAEKKSVLKLLASFGSSGIEINLFAQISGLSCKDNVNDLIDERWINENAAVLSLHPVIRETIQQWEWTKLDCTTADRVMNGLIALLEHSENDKKRKVLPLYLDLSEHFLHSCQYVYKLQGSGNYLSLLYWTVIKMPREREAFVLEKSKELLKVRLFTDRTAVMKVYSAVALIYNERKDFERAWNIILHAKKFIRPNDKPYIKALYYHLSADFYDARLNGEYEYGNEAKDKAQLQRALDRIIFYLKKSSLLEERQLLVESILGKANLLIRDCSKKGTEIRKLLSAVDQILENQLEFPRIYRGYYWMSRAWFSALIEVNYSNAVICMNNSLKIAGKYQPQNLDFIDMWLIPCANIYAEFKDYKESAHLLKEAIALCDAHPDVIPYMRKRIELLGYLQEVYGYAGDDEKRQGILSLIKEQNSKEVQSSEVNRISP